MFFPFNTSIPVDEAAQVDINSAGTATVTIMTSQKFVYAVFQPGQIFVSLKRLPGVCESVHPLSSVIVDQCWMQLVLRWFLGLDNRVRMSADFTLHRLALLGLCSLLCTAAIYPQESTHKISFTFDYDFGATPACSRKVTTGCVQQFNLYDISQGTTKRVKLGSIPVPAGASGQVKGISGITEPLLFNSGKHLIAVTAQLPDGSESNPRKCTTIVEIP